MLAFFAFIVALLSATIVAVGQMKIETQLVAEMDLPGAKGGKANGTLTFDGKQVFLATKAGLRVFDTSNLSIYSFIKEGEGVLHAWTDSQTGGLFVVEGLIPKAEKGGFKRLQMRSQ